MIWNVVELLMDERPSNDTRRIDSPCRDLIALVFTVSLYSAYEKHQAIISWHTY